MTAEIRVCPVTGEQCITGVCSTYECSLERKIGNDEKKIVDKINGFSLNIAQTYQLGAEQTLKLAEKISQFLLNRLKSK